MSLLPPSTRARLRGALKRARAEQLLLRLQERGALTVEAADDIADELDRDVQSDLGALLASRGVPPEVTQSVERALASEDFAELPEAAPPDEVQAALAKPGRVLDEFVLVETLGKGGGGEVWRAWDRRLARYVAIKRPRLAADNHAGIERLQREALAAAKLNHPNVVPIYKVGQAEGETYLVMPLIEGRTMAEARPPLRQAIEAVRIIALALDEAHRQGLVHRDVKPSNLMLDQAGRVWLLDFGLAYLTENAGAQETRPGEAFGTAAYMSPEQAAGDAAASRSPATDVYGLGATLYELATGTPPFSGASFAEIVLKVLRDPPRPARQIDTALSIDLETVLLRALAKDPRARYPTAATLAEDLRRVLADEPITARRPGPVERLGRHGRRRWRVYAAAGLALLAVAGVGAYERHRSRLERAAALETVRQMARSSLETALRLRRAGDLAGMRQVLPALRSAYDLARLRAPELAEPEYLMGRMYRALMDEPRALEHQERALAKTPDYAPALYERLVLLARRYDRENQLARGLQKPDAEPAVGPPGAQAVLAGLRRTLMNDARALGGRASSAAQALAVRGIVAHHEGSAQIARKLLEEAVAHDPYLDEAWQVLAESRSGAPAERIYSRALERDRGYLPFWTGRCRARADDGRNEAAVEDASHAIAADDSQVSARLCRGRARMQIGHRRMFAGDDPGSLYAEAESDFERALRIEPRAWGALWGLGTLARYQATHIMRSGGDPRPALDRSEVYLDRCLALQPADPARWAARGRTRTMRAVALGSDERATGEYERASADLSHALELERANATARDWLGELGTQRALFLWRRGEDPAPAFGAAEATFAAALEKSREPWMLFHAGVLALWRGIAETRAGRDPLPLWATAERRLSLAVEIDGQVADFHLHRAVLREERARYLRARGRPSAADLVGAAADRDRARQLNPRIEEVRFPGPPPK